MATRSAAAVDRLTGAVERHATACVEFVPGAGLWTVVSFADSEQYERWNGPVRAAFRLLADSGFGGERTRGWGRSEAPEFIEGELPDMILPPRVATPVEAKMPPSEPEPEPKEPEPKEPEPLQPEPPRTDPPEAEPPRMDPPLPEPSVQAESLMPLELSVPQPEGIALQPEPEVAQTTAGAQPEPIPQPSAPSQPSRDREGADRPAPPAQHWLLSLFTPGPDDNIDWTKGSYSVLSRSGRIESPVRQGELKKQLNMVAEGSVLMAAAAPQGSSPDVAPDGFPHPVYRAGFALAIPLPAQVTS